MGRFDQHLVATLHAILQTGSISKAALVLGVSQPAVSQALRKLRAHFGDELFVRSGQGLLPTQRMLALQPVVERLLRDLEMLSRPPEGWSCATSSWSSSSACPRSWNSRSCLRSPPSSCGICRAAACGACGRTMRSCCPCWSRARRIWPWAPW